MPHTERSSDVQEVHGEHALEFGIGGLVAVLLGALFIYYQGTLFVLGILLAVGGTASLGYAIYCYQQIKKVPSFSIACPYCHGKNVFTEEPQEDETCVQCHRLMPIVKGRLLRVSQVRCGFCGTLNYYSEKSVGLLCEECDREIPIAVSDGMATEATHKFAAKTDDKRYELILTETGHKNEQLIQHLQHLLALNRNQVKDMIAAVPCTLLTNVPRMKAELVQKDLAKFEGKTDIIELSRMN
ncbi:MAG: hypothetical protein JNM85_07995 [Chthonomonas sp.]|nr:hypothetical protein [Chthonomonas sp.]